MNAASDANMDMFHDHSRRYRDDLLFAQPRSSCYGDCPICCLPLPLVSSCHHDIVMMSCCSKMICNGCIYVMRKRNEALNCVCPFCRHPAPTTKEEAKANFTRRLEANDPHCNRIVGQLHYSRGDYAKAFQYRTKATEQGDAISHHQLSFMYMDGKGVEKDIRKSIHHSVEAAIGGHPMSRFNLGAHEWNNGSEERAVKHWIIAANLGEENSIKELREAYVEGFLSKDDYAAVLRSYQAATDAMKSPQRVLACMSSFSIGIGGLDFTL